MSKLKPPPIEEYMDQLFPSQQGERDLEGLKVVAIERVRPRPNQPRRFFDRARLGELASDIRKQRESGGGIGGTGIVQPLLVTLAADGRGYILTAGERRWRAAQEAENLEVPVLVRDQSNEDAYEDALRENIQREDLTVLEEAEALRHIMDERRLSVRLAAERFGKDKGWVENRLRLLKAGEDVQEMVSLRKDTLSHGYLIDQVQEPQQRRALIRAVIDDEASVATIRRRIADFEQREAKPEARRVPTGEAPSTGVTSASSPPTSAPEPTAALEPTTGPITSIPSRSVELPDPTPALERTPPVIPVLENPDEVLTQALHPAVALTGEAMRLLEGVALTAELREVLREELLLLEDQVARLLRLVG